MHAQLRKSVVLIHWLAFLLMTTHWIKPGDKVTIKILIRCCFINAISRSWDNFWQKWLSRLSTLYSSAEGDKFNDRTKAEATSLFDGKNEFSTSSYQDHLLLSRQRVNFLKPDLFLVIDDCKEIFSFNEITQNSRTSAY